MTYTPRTMTYFQDRSILFMMPETQKAVMINLLEPLWLDLVDFEAKKLLHFFDMAKKSVDIKKTIVENTEDKIRDRNQLQPDLVTLILLGFLNFYLNISFTFTYRQNSMKALD